MGRFVDAVHNINNVPQYKETLTGTISIWQTVSGNVVSREVMSGSLSLPKEVQSAGLLHYEANTTEFWNTYRIPSKKDTLYVYLDYIEGEDRPSCVSFKWGDGMTDVVDLPFANKNLEYEAHIHDSTVHITKAERERWNNKERAVTDDELLVFIK